MLVALPMHPVPCGLVAGVHAPAEVDGATGGSGSSLTLIGSGLGAGGTARPEAAPAADPSGAAVAGVTAPPIVIVATTRTATSARDQVLCRTVLMEYDLRGGGWSHVRDHGK
ncbi:hypothetical protein GCM10009727_71890 [Actinomadura napierensis]|uniref:IPT/TIG domain-containing protein n=1 Tax=Actinomadura napierensis TaxID=267854 RepID=A0ABP5M272_9ACTN